MDLQNTAPQHPERQNIEPFASMLKGDLRSALAGGEHTLLELVMANHAGMTTNEVATQVIVSDRSDDRPQQSLSSIELVQP